MGSMALDVRPNILRNFFTLRTPLITSIEAALGAKLTIRLPNLLEGLPCSEPTLPGGFKLLYHELHGLQGAGSGIARKCNVNLVNFGAQLRNLS